MEADVVVVGGGVGGCAAALTLAETGHRVILTEEFAWIGGQLTSQAVPPDEHGWIERFGCTATYRKFRTAVRAYYQEHYPLTPEAAANPLLNPGNGWVSPLCHEPRVALAVLEAMLAPQVRAERLVILREHRPVAVERAGEDALAAVIVQGPTGARVRLAGRMFLDATENGDLLPLAEVEHVTGSEARVDTGEPGAAETANPRNIQAFSVCFVMDAAGAVDGSDLVPAPSGYTTWRDEAPNLQPPWPGPMLSWRGLNPRTMAEMDYTFHPHGETPGLFSGLWSFRRIIDRSLFQPGRYASDVCLVNWPMIDYLDGDLISGTREDAQRHLAQARDLSRAMMHWLQHEAPRPDGGRGWPELRLRPDVTGTTDGLAMAPYIRESRRIRALHTIVEGEVSADCRPGETLAERYEDSVGIGYYRIDLHPTTAGDNYHDVPSLPFRIPLGALVPVRFANLLPAAKNLGTTHITNGCYRLHPVEWNVGESTALLAATCLRDGQTPQQVATSPDRRKQLQAELVARGVELAWPENLVLDDGDPHAHAR